MNANELEVKKITSTWECALCAWEGPDLDLTPEHDLVCPGCGCFGTAFAAASDLRDAFERLIAAANDPFVSRVRSLTAQLCGHTVELKVWPTKAKPPNVV
jgi:hypothetical protein